MRIWTFVDVKTLDLQGFLLVDSTSPDVLGRCDGAAKRIRTPDPRITNALLYQLSYCGALPKRAGILPR
jgi:hypothetical protein